MPTLHEAIGAFIASIENPETKRAYGQALTRFEQVSPDELERVDETLLIPFTDQLRAKSAATRDLYQSAVISFFAFLVITKSSAPVSLDRARMLKKKLRGRAAVRISNYPMQEVQALVDYARDNLRRHWGRGQRYSWRSLLALRDRALILTLATTGLRRGEAVRMKLSDLDFETGQAVVIGKGNKQAVVYFSPDALEAVQDYIKARRNDDPDLPLFMRHSKGGKAWTRDPEVLDGTSINNAIKLRAREALGHDNISPHALRHYFVTRVWRETHDLMLAKELARHESVLTTQRYTHVENDELRGVHARIFGR